jgi:hypothetical protein
LELPLFFAEIISKYTLIWEILQEGKAFFVKNIELKKFLVVQQEDSVLKWFLKF